MRDHPDPKLLERFMRGEASALERRTIVRHMLTGCLQCLEVTSPLWRFGELQLLPLGEGPLEDGNPEPGDEGDDEEEEARVLVMEAGRAGSRLTR